MLSADFGRLVLPFFRERHNKRIAVIPGDGIGKEVIPQAVKVIEARRSVPVEVTYFDWGADRYLADGTTVPADGFAMLDREFDAIFVGAFGDPRVPTNIHAKEILLGMRFKMELYANVRPVRSARCVTMSAERHRTQRCRFRRHPRKHRRCLPGFGGIFKQGTADEIAIQEDINTRKGVERMIRYAFEYARTTRKPTAARAAES